MDILTVIGLVLAFGVLLGGAYLKAGSLMALWSLAALVVVMLGTIAAISVQTPPATMRRALQMAGWLFKPPLEEKSVLIERMVEWSRSARRKGLLALEAEVAKEPDPFIRRGLELVYDGAAPDTVRKVLEVEMSVRESADLAATKVYEGMGVYAPTLGIIGAVFGLIAVMNNLQDPSKLGPGIAAAFTATMYGIGTANLFMLPFASKLKQVVAMQGQTREMIVDGLAAIAEGENPRIVEAKLQGYLIRNAPVEVGEKPAEEKAG